MIRLFCFAVFTSLITGGASAQSMSDFQRSAIGSAAYYNYAEPGDRTIEVHVWGAVGFPGLYEIPSGARMSKLLSLAGGPVLGVRSDANYHRVRVELIRRDESGVPRSVYDEIMEDRLLMSENDPVLAGDDVLTIEAIAVQKFRWRDALPVITAVSTITLIIDRLAR